MGSTVTTNTTSTALPTLNSANPAQVQSSGNEEMRYHGTELVMLYDYKVRSNFDQVVQSMKWEPVADFVSVFQAQASDDLSVRRGDWIYADLNNQSIDGWLWAYAPKTRKYGFIPKAYARPPAMTSLWSKFLCQYLVLKNSENTLRFYAMTFIQYYCWYFTEVKDSLMPFTSVGN